jgi:hypothetical protein
MADGSILPDLETAVVRARRLLALLRQLSKMGMDLAEALHREAMDGGRVSMDMTQRFCRIAKAIRQLAALEMRLAQALDDVAAGRWETEEAERELDAISAKTGEDEAFEAVAQAIREAGDGEAFERLSERLDDWYAERSVERDFHDKSVAEIVTHACKLIGLDPDPALLTDEAMSQTLADAVRAYAAALKAEPRTSPPELRETQFAPPQRRPNSIAEARPPPA